MQFLILYNSISTLEKKIVKVFQHQESLDETDPFFQVGQFQLIEFQETSKIESRSSQNEYPSIDWTYKKTGVVKIVVLIDLAWNEGNFRIVLQQKENNMISDVIGK